jgi:hypothetical protein
LLAAVKAAKGLADEAGAAAAQARANAENAASAAAELETAAAAHARALGSAQEALTQMDYVGREQAQTLLAAAPAACAELSAVAGRLKLAADRQAQATAELAEARKEARLLVVRAQKVKSKLSAKVRKVQKAADTADGAAAGSGNSPAAAAAAEASAADSLANAIAGVATERVAADLALETSGDKVKRVRKNGFSAADFGQVVTVVPANRPPSCGYRQPNTGALLSSDMGRTASDAFRTKLTAVLELATRQTGRRWSALDVLPSCCTPKKRKLASLENDSGGSGVVWTADMDNLLVQLANNYAFGYLVNFNRVAEEVGAACDDDIRPSAAECCERFKSAAAEAEGVVLRLMASDEYKPVPPLSLFGLELYPEALDDEEAAPVAYIHISEAEVYTSIEDGRKASELRHAHATAWVGEGGDRSPYGGSVTAGDLHEGDVVVFFHFDSAGRLVGACCCKVVFVVSAQ